ncbi:hypothetical protein LJC30_06215, partial [Odoribacter sp. OttesenSCG-928-L07]|nr:hypothetical protein [Odoribacter sp. OttesenSCG-928-L07]
MDKADKADKMDKTDKMENPNPPFKGAGGCSDNMDITYKIDKTDKMDKTHPRRGSISIGAQRRHNSAQCRQAWVAKYETMIVFAINTIDATMIISR